MATQTKSKIGQGLTFETPMKNLHKLMFEADNTLSIVDDYGDTIGIKALEVEPIGDGLLKVTAEILWIQDKDEEPESK